jgi:hypothetical protein|tara:strand:- start:880 stop:2808 length:1929 start_codon:yes stop_codon:yes gene_type:complete
MAKISNLIAYPTVAAQLGDYVIGTDTSNSNETVNFTLQSIADIIPADTLAEVLAAGNTATNNINLTGNITLTGNLSTSGTIADSSGDVGVAGQVLSSTGTGTNWVNNVDGAGTLNTLAKWTPDGNTLGDSSITDDGTSVIVANDIYLQGSTIHIGNAVTDSAIVNGTMTFLQNARINSTLQDGGGNAGGNGQVLSSTVTGVTWIDQLPSGLNFQGSWDANANSPALASGVGVQGYYYIVGTPGTTNLDGNNSWQTGDWAIFNGTAWQEIDNQNIFSGSGTANTVTKWTGAQSLGNSSITDDGTSVVVANDTYLQGSTIHIGNAPTDSAVVNGTMTFQQNARFNSTMQDVGGQPGTSGQVLSSTGTSVLWKSVVDGSGTTHKIPKWADSDTLTDSALSDNAGAVALSGTSFTSTTSANQTLTSNTGAITLSSSSDLSIDSATVLHLNQSNPTISIKNWGPAVFEESAYFKKTILDSTAAAGTAGQILSSTGTATQWINNSSALPLADGTRVVQGTVTSAQILNMFTSPVVLISDPGGSKIIVVDSVVVKYNFVTSDYSNIGFPSIKYRVVSSGLLGNGVTGTLPMSGSQDNWKIFTDTNTSTVPGSEIVVSTAPQNPTGGDSTLFYNIKYRILNSSDLTIDLT